MLSLCPNSSVRSNCFSYLRARKPLACAWKAMMTTVSLRSLSSSSWARTPVLKNILLWPIRYRLVSRSRCFTWRRVGDKREGEKWSKSETCILKIKFWKLLRHPLNLTLCMRVCTTDAGHVWHFWNQNRKKKIQFHPAYHQTASLLPIHEALRDGVGSQDLISKNKKNTWQYQIISHTNVHCTLYNLLVSLQRVMNMIPLNANAFISELN